jgi:hypothetical protein
MALYYSAPRGRTERFSLLRIHCEAKDCLLQFFPAARSYEQRRPLMLQNLGQLIEAAGNYRLSHRHIFEELCG